MRLRRRIRLVSSLTATVFALSAVGQIHAGTLQEAACVIFDGKSECRTISVVDEENCVIKIHPGPVPDLDPAIAGCLIDDVDTKKVYLRNARLSAANVGTQHANSTVRVTGRQAIQVLTNYDDKGAPVWEWRGAETFKRSGDPVKTAMAMVQLHDSLCRHPVASRGPVSVMKTQAVRDEPASGTMSVAEAHREAAEGRMLLVDVRHESEWQQTGIGENAVPITMHQRAEEFMAKLRRAAGSDTRQLIGLICASGVRSSYIQKFLQSRGFSRVYDVHEGMLGEQGWIKSGLPVTPYIP